MSQHNRVNGMCRAKILLCCCEISQQIRNEMSDYWHYKVKAISNLEKIKKKKTYKDKLGNGQRKYFLVIVSS